ncbi:MAG: hypothetical protein GY832_15020, partial [Chloroflexi bacterium]|nr:hypothetical protein [Chloroflexota bacterium]
MVIPLADDECCSDPGAISECWWRDADRDGITCSASNACPDSRDCNYDDTGPLNQGLCECEDQEDCYDGDTLLGVCNASGVCGPSYCNGYMACSCWGGCEEVTPGGYDNPEDMCEDTGSGFPGYCCEGSYSEDPTGIVLGYCSDQACDAGGTRCDVDGDCNDSNPCTTDTCDGGFCAAAQILDGAPEAPGCTAIGRTLSTDCARPWCEVGACIIDYINEDVACTDNKEFPPAGAEEDCYEHTCSADGICELVISEDALCDDDNDCTAATCNASAVCSASPLGDDALVANPECCDPAKGWSFDDAYDCTGDTCPTGTGNDSYDYYDQNTPDDDLGDDCCVDSTHCSDGNNCTTDVCCNTSNKDEAVCGGVADFECELTILDQSGCCDTAPPAMADNCEDIYDCTENICCPPGSADPECVGIDDYHCADAIPYDPLPDGCCDPSESDAECDDGSACTADACIDAPMSCSHIPLPDIVGCCGSDPADACGDFDDNECSDEVCCDDATIAAAEAGDPCFGESAWSCDVVPSEDPGCCDDASDCDDGNPCTEDTCVDYTCSSETYDTVDLPAGCCNAPFGDNDAQCSDASDPNNCTDNICCSEALTTDPSSPCNGLQVYRCANGAKDPLPDQCCNPDTVAANCNPDGNICVQESCSNNNCAWTIDDGPAACCDENGDCPETDPVTRPCLDSSSCNLSDDPIANSDYATCDMTYKAADTVCGVSGDPCWDLVCDPDNDDWDCVAHKDVPDYPDAEAVQCTSGVCGAFWCDGSGGCTHFVDGSTTYDNDDCTGSESLAGGDPITRADEDGECAGDDYTTAITGRFATCVGADYSDIVYDFDDSVADSYGLVHRVVQVDPAGAPDWDGFIYTQKTCGDSSTQQSCNNDCDFTGTNYTLDYYDAPLLGECDGSESTVMTGPYAAEDVPNHNTSSLPDVNDQDFDDNDVRDGYDVDSSHNTTLIVDSRYTEPSTGGEFDLLIDEEPHNNNHCRNTASYMASPIIDGSHGWKQRWRGNIDSDDYNNYFGAGGPAMGYDGVPSDTNPRQAFFKVELSSGDGKYLAYTDWYSMQKYGEAGHDDDGDAASQGASFFHATLSWLDPMVGDTTLCDSPPVGQSASYSDGYIPQWSIDASSSDVDGWLAVANRDTDSVGDYELTVIKAQPKFFGFVTGYSKEGAEQGCGTLDHFDGEGIRLDFIPSGTTENGYLMTVTDEGEGPDTCPGMSGDRDDWGWLVHPYCYGPSGSDEALDYDSWHGGGHHQVWKLLPFKFPLGDKFYPALYFDSTGRIEP